MKREIEIKRPKKEDFKVKYNKGDVELCSVIKQYSKAQDEYIDYLEQLNIHDVIKSVCDDCTAYPFDERGKTPLCGTCKDNPKQTVL